jgi:cytochrome c2
VRVVRPDAASNTGYQLGSEPGQAMFAKLCAPCHTIGKGNRVGPDLRGVADRREPAWLAQFMRHPQAMINDKDPIAIALAATFKGARMPDLGVTENDATDLIVYLKAETARLNGVQNVAAQRDEHRD